MNDRARRVIDARVVNLDELALEHFGKGDRFASECARLGHTTSMDAAIDYWKDEV